MRVLLATDRPDLGHALTLFLSERSIQVVDVVDDVGSLMDRAAASRPDVVLVDWCLGDAVSSRMVADLMDRDDPTPVIVLTTAQDRSRAHACGAAAYATFGDTPDSLVTALREVSPDPSAGAGPRAD
ncbi:MAG TPA: response regulator [Thermoleophilia bacterium]|nr:response regulator [Thermoleophilia bacterium]